MWRPAALTMLLALGAASVVVVSPAPAAPVVYGPVQATIVNGGTIPLTPTDFGPSTVSLGGKNPFQVQQFNPSDYKAPPGKVAELYAVGIHLDYGFKNTISMTFTNASTINVSASGVMHLTLPDKVTDLVGTPTFGTAANHTTPAGTTHYALTMPTKDVTGASAMGYGQSSPQVLAAFTGNSTLNLPVFATATSSFTTTTGNGVGTSITSATATLSVVYYYTFVPEPSSVVLTGFGGVGLLLAYRRGRLRRKA